MTRYNWCRGPAIEKHWFRLSAVFWERSVDTSAFFGFFIVFHTRSSPYGRAAPDLQANVAISFSQISPKSRKPHQNFRRQKDGMKPFSDWEPACIWRHDTKFSRLGDLVPGICTRSGDLALAASCHLLSNLSFSSRTTSDAVWVVCDAHSVVK